MSEERIRELEHKLLEHHSMIEGHDKDLHSIAKSLEGINGHMNKTNELLQDFALKDERFNNKLDKIESNMLSRIDKNEEAIKRAHDRSDRYDDVLRKIGWWAIFVIASGIVGAMVKFG